MQHGLGPTLEHEEIDQPSREDMEGGVDSLGEKQGVQDTKMTKPRQRYTQK